MRMNINMKKNVGFLTLVAFVVCFGSFLVVDGLLPPSQVPPCFGAQGSSERGIDVYYSAYANSFYTSTHHSYWNYTTETSHMRYDVIGACDVTSANSSNPCPGGDFSQTNLFHYEAGLAWNWIWPTDGNSWENGLNCTVYSVNVTTFECVPSDFKPTGYINLAGVDCTIWSSADGTQQQVATSNVNTPILVQIINRDENLNIKEFVQIINYVPYVPSPMDLAVPSFCPTSV